MNQSGRYCCVCITATESRNRMDVTVVGITRSSTRSREKRRRSSSKKKRKKYIVHSYNKRARYYEELPVIE